MIKVLEKGKKNIVYCDFCGAKLQYEKEDVYERQVLIDSLRSNFLKVITCPECKCRVALEDV